MPMTFGRRTAMAGLTTLLAAPRLAAAQTITRDVRMIVPYAPGGTVDILGRLLAEALPPVIGHNVVVENRSGAGAYIGMQTVANAAADGHTLGLAPDLGLSVSPIIPGATLPIDPDKTLAPISGLVQVPTLLVARNEAPFNTLAEMIEYAKSQPNGISVGKSGTGTVTHLLVARLASLTGMKFEYIPYRGGTPALLDVMSGTLDCYFSLITESIPHVQAQKMKPIVFASAERNPLLPNVPTLKETWSNFTGTADYGLIGAAGLSPEWVSFWQRTVAGVLTQPAVRGRLERLLAIPTGTSTEAYLAKLRADREVWGKVVRDANIRVD